VLPGLEEAEMLTDESMRAQQPHYWRSGREWSWSSWANVARSR
jgi:hypothetical protein